MLLLPLLPPLQGVRFETVAIDASPEFLEMYDAAVDAWQATRDYMADKHIDKGGVAGVSATTAC